MRRIDILETPAFTCWYLSANIDCFPKKSFNRFRKSSSSPRESHDLLDSHPEHWSAATLPCISSSPTEVESPLNSSTRKRGICCSSMTSTFWSMVNRWNMDVGPALWLCRANDCWSSRVQVAYLPISDSQASSQNRSKWKTWKTMN